MPNDDRNNRRRQEPERGSYSARRRPSAASPAKEIVQGLANTLAPGVEANRNEKRGENRNSFDQERKKRDPHLRKENSSSREVQSGNRGANNFRNQEARKKDKPGNLAPGVNPLRGNHQRPPFPGNSKLAMPLPQHRGGIEIANNRNRDDLEYGDEEENQNSGIVHTSQRRKKASQKRKQDDSIDVLGNVSGFLKKMFPFLLAGGVFIFFVSILAFMILFIITQSGFSPLLGINTQTGGDTGGMDYTTDNKDEMAFYNRVVQVQEEYAQNNKNVDVQIVVGVVFMLQNYSEKLDYKDIDDRAIRTIVDAMFDSGNGEENTTYDKDQFIENLKKDVFPKYLPDVDKNSYDFIALEIFEYIDAYKELISDGVGGSLYGSGNTLYWWPIGSSDTTDQNGIKLAGGDPVSTNITSYFGGRVNPKTGAPDNHSGIDISAPQGTNVIAALDGTVVYPPSKTTSCVSFGDSSCGGTYGNYIIIQHVDGNYTLYAHLHQNSVYVQAGDNVRQGQVIGGVGSSGNSTGYHLHFEVRKGVNSFGNTTDPLEYVDPANPRPQSFSGMFSQEFITMLHSWEGTGRPKEGDNYVAYDDGTGVITVGYGVAVRYNLERFAQFGIDGNSIRVGTKVPAAIVDQVEMMELKDNYDYVIGVLTNAGITDLNQKQIEALISRTYNTGNIKNFPKYYKQYGNSQALYDNYMSQPVTGGGVYYPGLERRRKAEWALFHEGRYVNNS